MVVGDRSQTGDDKHREGKGEDGYDAPGFGYLDVPAFIDILSCVSEGFHPSDKPREDEIGWIKGQDECQYAIKD